MLYQQHQDVNISHYELVFVITEEPHIKYALAPYVVLRDDKGEYTYSTHRVYANTVKDYNISLTDEGKQLFANLEELAVPYLEDKFKPKRRRRMTLGELMKDEKLRKYIINFVETRFATVLDLIYRHNAGVFFQHNKSEKLTRHPISLAHTHIDAVFNFKRTNEGINYGLSASLDDQEITLSGREVHILCNKPGWLIIDNTLYPTNDSLNGKLFQPFVQKDAITIAKDKEREFFEKFIIQKVRKNHVNAEGFEIITNSPTPSMSLSLEKSPFDESANFLAARFYYENEQFPAYDKRQERVTIGFDDQGAINLYKTKRAKKKEKALISKLAEFGFEEQKQGYFTLESGNGDENGEQNGQEDPLYDLIDRLTNLRDILEKNNIYIDSESFADQTVTFHKPELDFTVKRQNDWFDIKATVTIGSYKFPFTKFYEHILNGQREFQLPDGSVAILPKEWFARYRELLTLGNQDREHIFLSRNQGALLKEISKTNGKANNDLLPDFNIGEPTGEVPIPSSLKASLRPYQQHGLNWMAHIQQQGFGGCLADEMGLGKTLQTLALLLHFKMTSSEEGQQECEIPGKENGTEKAEEQKPQLDLFSAFEKELNERGKLRALIVMPVSLIHNWKLEIQRFTPSMSIYQHTGINRKRSTKVFYNHDVTLTTYSIARNDLQLLQKVNFSCIVLDESQYIKNPRSKTYKAVTQLNGQRRMVLTGTPIENSLSDLWSQVNFFNPGMLGSFRFFKEEFIDPIEKQEDEQKRARLKNLVQPFILRRTIRQVAKDLPNLTEKVFYSEMLPEQKELYEEEKSRARNKILENLKTMGRAKSNILILKSLTRLRQIANHPSLCLNAEGEQYGSGKYSDVLDNLDGLLEGEEHKVLIFSQFVSHLNLFKDHLDQQGLSYGYLTGAISSEKRQVEIEKFQEDPATRVFLISLSAGGTGLNLTAANHVFMLDPWWNPAREEQAIRRAHRIGQDKNVFAYKFITVDTVEEKILKLQQRKKELAEDFMPSEEQINLSNEDLEYLLE